MTLSYLAQTYRVPIEELIKGLGVPADAPKDTSLKNLADREHVSRFVYVTRAQQVISGLLPPLRIVLGSDAPEDLMEWIATWLLRYGYGAFALVLLLGAVGIPLPSGLSAALAGSFVALGRMHWVGAVGTAIAASVVGDMIGYGVGRVIGDRFLRHHGRWVGYNEERHQQLQALFARWGWLAIVLSRTLLSSLSAPVNLAVGAFRWSAPGFLSSVLLGRTLWTIAYIGLGYIIAGDIESAAEFLKNFTGLLISIACAVGSIAYLPDRRQESSAQVAR